MVKKIIWITGIIAVLGVVIFSIAKVKASENACLAHVYTPATCTSPKTCIYCGHQIGTALGHNFVQEGDYYTCTRCGIIY